MRILNGIGLWHANIPVHEVLIDGIGIDERLALRVVEQGFGLLLNDVFWMAAGSQLLQMSSASWVSM